MELEQFGAYRIEALLGRGGMGDVYRAFDTEHDRVVALKVLSEALAADRGYRERFRREAALAARLDEPHIVPIHRYGEIDGRLFLDLRLVPGRDVAAVLAQDGPMSPERAVAVVSQAARALDSAHAEGLVHRDVTPSHVLLTGEGDDEFVSLTGFGIARSTTDSQRFPEKPVDQRTDVHALACVLFECLTGRRPFLGDGPATPMPAQLDTVAPTPSSLRPDLPAALDDVVRTGLAKDPDERYGTAGELASAARTALATAGVTPRPEARAPATPPTSITPIPDIPPQPVGYSDPGPAGGYGPPSHPGQGFYGQGPPPYPPGGPEGASSSGSGGKRTLLPILLGVGALVVVGVVVLAIVVSGGNGGGDDPAVTTSAGSSSSGSSSSSSSASPSDQGKLRAEIPAGFTADNCTPIAPAGDGDLAALDCGGSTAHPGPDFSRFYLYPTSGTLEKVFLDDVTGVHLRELSGKQDCPNNQGYYFYTAANGDHAGRVACYVGPDDNAVLVWTQDDAAAEAVVQITGGGTDGLATLWNWWQDGANSDFQV